MTPPLERTGLPAGIRRNREEQRRRDAADRARFESAVDAHIAASRPRTSRGGAARRRGPAGDSGVPAPCRSPCRFQGRSRSTGRRTRSHHDQRGRDRLDRGRARSLWRRGRCQDCRQAEGRRPRRTVQRRYGRSRRRPGTRASTAASPTPSPPYCERVAGRSRTPGLRDLAEAGDIPARVGRPREGRSPQPLALRQPRATSCDRFPGSISAAIPARGSVVPPDCYERTSAYKGPRLARGPEGVGHTAPARARSAGRPSPWSGAGDSPLGSLTARPVVPPQSVHDPA